MRRVRLVMALGGLCLAGATAQAGDADAAARADYMVHCQGCHLPDGAGRPPEVPSLVADMAKFLSIDGGRAYLVQVPGTANSALDNARVAALLNWMLAQFTPGGLPSEFRPYTTAEVASYRAERLPDPVSRRASLLAQARP
jgi:mono/diheme cytochrome c family protein